MTSFGTTFISKCLHAFKIYKYKYKWLHVMNNLLSQDSIQRTVHISVEVWYAEMDAE